MNDTNDPQSDCFGKPERWIAAWNRCVQLHDDLEEFCYLFAESGPRVELMNRAAPAFFHSLQILMWQDMLLKISKITDPSRGGRKSNSSVESLVEECAPHNLKEAAEMASAAKEAANFARDWRNRKLAHDDLGLALGSDKVEPLAEASIILLRGALRQIAAVLDICDPDGGTTYWTPARNAKGARSLIRNLQIGEHEIERRRLACENGEMGWRERWLSPV